MGFFYGMISQNINAWLLPGVPLSPGEGSRLLMTVVTVLAGAGLGFLATFFEEAVWSLISSSFVAAFATSLQAAQAEEWKFAVIMLLFLYTLLPRMVFFLPVAALVRWASGQWDREPGLWVLTFRKRGFSTLVILVLSIGTGLFSLMPPEEREAVRDMDNIIRVSLQAHSTDELPGVLAPVPGYIENARGDYLLSTSDEPDLLPVKRPMVPFGTPEPLVIARFQNGYRFGCVYTYGKPACWTFR